MSQIKSELIIGYPNDRKLMDEIRKELGALPGQEIRFQVMRTTVDNVEYWVCWSGGKLKEGAVTANGVDHHDVAFTQTGDFALRTLIDLPFGSSTIYIQELRMGKIPLQEKVINMLKERAPGSKICFVGDLAKELDGKMCVSFNLIDGVEL